MPLPHTRHWVVALLLFAVQPAWAASEFDGYRIPDHHWSAWSANLTASGRSSGDNISPDFRGHQGQFSVRGGGLLQWGRDSDREQHTLSLSPDVRGFRGTSQRRLGSPVFDELTDRQRQMIEALDVAGTMARYSARAPFGIAGSAVFRGRLSQDWSAREASQRIPPAEARGVSDFNSHSYFYLSSISIGPIVGRVRDATPVLDARTLEDRLTRTHALAQPLSEVGRARLAELLATRSAFRFAHTRPERYFWREVERLLREDGALAGTTLDSWSVLRVLEGVSPNLAPRFTGSSFQVFVTALAIRDHSNSSFQNSFAAFDHDTLIAAIRNQSSSEQNSRRDLASVGYDAEYHRPVGLRWQFDASQQLNWNDAAGALFLFDRLSATWMIADRWRATSNWTHSASSRGRSSSRKIEAWGLRHLAELQYQLEDAWALSLSWQHEQNHDRTHFAREDAFSLGVSYQFSGRFTAPGLIEPMQLAPPNR